MHSEDAAGVLRGLEAFELRVAVRVRRRRRDAFERPFDWFVDFAADHSEDMGGHGVDHVLVMDLACRCR